MRASGGWASALARTSAYPRPDKHLSQQTVPGAALSISAVLLLAFLLSTELRDFWNVQSTKKLGVDTVRGQAELPVLLNITFPALPCAVISLEALDLAGAHEWEAHMGVNKTRLDAQGQPLSLYVAPASEFDLFSIFGAANAQLLRLSGLFHLTGPEAMREMQEALAAHEGCNLYGSLPVPRVAGDIHVTANTQSGMILRQAPDGSGQLNTSHTIHTLRFGPPVPGMSGALDEFVRTIGEGQPTGSYKYFLKLVPTQIRRGFGRVYDTYQYSVTEFFTASKFNDGSLPAVYFSYDFSPVSLTIEERRRPLFHFLTRICAVVGGVFALFGMFSKLLV